MPNLSSIALALFAGLTLGASGSWYATARYKDAQHAAQLSAQSQEAMDKLKLAAEKASATERRHNELAVELGKRHAEAQKALDDVYAENRRLARELGGLRDPGKRPSGGDAVPSHADPASDPGDVSACARLSDEASEFLLDLAREADRAAEYAQTCHSWLLRLRANHPND